MVIRHGVARWMNGTGKVSNLRQGTAILRIATKTGVDLYRVYHGEMETRVQKQSDKTVYALNVETGFCECPDHKAGNSCKHVRALYAALPYVGN